MVDFYGGSKNWSIMLDGYVYSACFGLGGRGHDFFCYVAHDVKWSIGRGFLNFVWVIYEDEYHVASQIWDCVRTSYAESD